MGSRATCSLFLLTCELAIANVWRLKQGDVLAHIFWPDCFSKVVCESGCKVRLVCMPVK